MKLHEVNEIGNETLKTGTVWKKMKLLSSFFINVLCPPIIYLNTYSMYTIQFIPVSV